MYLSKLNLSTAYLNKATRHLRAGLFQEHQMIWNLFQNPTDNKRDFLYRREDEPGTLPFFYLLSARSPDNVGNEFVIQTKEYKPVVLAGDNFSFSLRANAVVTRKVDDNNKKRRRRDIIESKVDEYKKRYSEPADRPPPAVIHQEAADEWLAKQGERCGFHLSSFFVENHQFHKVKKPGDQNIRRFTSLDFHGQMAVTDVERFLHTLTNGIGRSKAFGCGLLLIRRIY